MKKVLLHIILLLIPLIILVPSHYSAEELASNKGQTSDFYTEMKNNLQIYLQELEDSKITEDQFKVKVENNITSQLKTEEDINDLLESEKKVTEPLSLKPYYGFGAFGIKGTEIALFAKHPIYSSKAKKAADKALKNAQKRYKNYTLWQGNGDAYRHAYWSALMTKRTSRDFAYEAGYAHEGYKPGTYKKIKSLDDKMDIKNNHNGRKLGTKYKGKTDKYISNRVAEQVSKKNMVRIRTYTSGKASKYIDGVPTKYKGKFVKTSDGGRKY